MPTYRTDKEGKVPFTRIENAVLQDEWLSWKARGLLAYMLSKPDNFRFYLEELTKHAPDGLDSVKAGVKELEVLGYINRYSIKEKGKFVSWQMNVYEKPQVGLPQVEKPLVDNPLLITNELITNDKITNDKTYIVLDIEEDSYLKIYNDHFKKRFNKDHMPVSEKNYLFIGDRISVIKVNSELKDWKKKVAAHFKHLPKDNDGNILPFLYASYRHFSVNEYN